MKQIKISDYALINVKELDERIEELVKLKKQTFENRKELYKNIEHKHYRNSVMSINSSMYSLYNSQLKILEEIKQSLIPSEKLDEVAFNEGTKAVQIKITNFDKNTVGYSKAFTTRQINEQVELHIRKYDKQDFLNNNIEID